MLLEDSTRRAKLDVLEAQYYRAVITKPWGESHLKGHYGSWWVGAGCRDTSAIISTDLIQLHAANLARQLRLKFEDTNASIVVWHVDSKSGAMKVNRMKSEKPIAINSNNVSINWDEGTRKKVHRLRKLNLPNETGGILLGYFDLKLSRVYIVDVLPAPGDSQGDEKGFTRGILKLEEDVQNASERTAGIVSYIGDWHSHPAGTTTNPSTQDIYLLEHLALELYRDGLPALMLIVGDEEERWLVGEVQ